MAKRVLGQVATSFEEEMTTWLHEDDALIMIKPWLYYHHIVVKPQAKYVMMTSMCGFYMNNNTNVYEFSSRELQR